MMNDALRPRSDPAQTIYDAFQLEAEKRDGRSTAEWQEAERQTVYDAAKHYAEKHSLHIPTMEDVKRAEMSAYGQRDYGSKWAYAMRDIMLKHWKFWNDSGRLAVKEERT